MDMNCSNKEDQPCGGPEPRVGEVSDKECSGEGEPYVFKAENSNCTKGLSPVGPGKFTKRKRGGPPLSSGNPKPLKKLEKRCLIILGGSSPQ